MDPKNINQLDPKLKEAYDRVMGMDISSSQQASQPTDATLPPVAPAPPVPQTPPQDTQPQMPQEQTPPPNPNIPPAPPPLSPTPEVREVPSQTESHSSPQSPPPVIQSFNASDSPMTSSPSTESGKSKSKISPMILLIVGLVFFVIYAVLWGKIFKIF